MRNSFEAIGLYLAGKFAPEHRQTAPRLGLCCFVLQNVPVFSEQIIGHTDDIGGDPIPGPASPGKPAVDDHVIAFGNDRARLVSQRRRRAPDQIEQAVAAGFDMRAVLDIGVRPEVSRRFIVALVEERVILENRIRGRFAP
jgi:hypothetical protein